ncbi:hypothetical protein KI688_012956 [Linnemannia hyalina]|uniref:Uncharacterized protein n=1 Tax=Linnemannia hyalina TaxID=64524 RepID=A0A9P8BSF0_9FUNG|nr:hypothetical protein KI688_012956 [Linnemannia hyalina]
MADKIQLLKDQPRYFGDTTQLNKEMLCRKTSSDESHDQAADDYFFDTPVRQWSVRDFLKNHSDSTPFIAGLDKIRRRHSVDKAIRNYATSWFKFMEGDLGKLRLEAFAAETKTSVTSGIIVEEERLLAQQRLRGHLREATAKALVQHEPVHTIPLLRKRGREVETEVQAKEDGSVNSPTYKKSAISLFEEDSLDGGSLVDEKDEDAVTLVQKRSHHPLNMVFDCQRFSFACVVGEQDVSRRFTDYYLEAVALPYDYHSFEDFLATGGILFLGGKPTRLQEQHFGEDFERLHKAVILGIEPNKDKDMLANQEDQAVEFCQAARNTFRKAERNVGSDQARKLLKQRIAQEEDSPLKDLYEYAAKLPKNCQPRILDELVTRMEITEEAQVLFFQVIGKKCTFYAMRRSGTVCVAVEIAKIKIAYTISDVLAGFEEDVRGWLLVDRTFQNLVSTLKSAMPRKPHSPPPPVFAGLRTPRSRRMSRDTHRPL